MGKKEVLSASDIKRYIVLNEDNEHEYDLTIETRGDEEKTSLSASNSGVWMDAIKGTMLMEMIDNGHNITFSKNLKNKMEYDEAHYVRTLLKIREQMGDNLAGPLRLIENKVIANV